MQWRPVKGRLQVAEGAIIRELLDPPSMWTEGGITTQECMYGLPPIMHRQLHDLGEPMIPPGVHIFPDPDHVLQEQLGLRWAS